MGSSIHSCGRRGEERIWENNCPSQQQSLRLKRLYLYEKGQDLIPIMTSTRRCSDCGREVLPFDIGKQRREEQEMAQQQSIDWYSPQLSLIPFKWPSTWRVRSSTEAQKCHGIAWLDSKEGHLRRISQSEALLGRRWRAKSIGLGHCPLMGRPPGSRRDRRKAKAGRGTFPW